jgi:hypothetical protein
MNAGLISIAHLGISAMGCQVLGEGLDGPGILALGHKQHAATNEIDKTASPHRRSRSPTMKD